MARLHKRDFKVKRTNIIKIDRIEQNVDEECVRTVRVTMDNSANNGFVAVAFNYREALWLHTELGRYIEAVKKEQEEQKLKYKEQNLF